MASHSLPGTGESETRRMRNGLFIQSSLGLSGFLNRMFVFLPISGPAFATFERHILLSEVDSNVSEAARTSPQSSLDSESRMTSATGPRHRRCETKPLLRNFQISRLDFVADAIPSGCHGSEICCSGSNEWVENRVSREREELD